jgi:hypothetical protein
MTHSVHSGRSLEHAVEVLFKHMGYHTKPSTVLHTRPAHIHAIIHHPTGPQKVLIECQHSEDEVVNIREVEKFCAKVAFAREHAIADSGLLVSKNTFSDEVKTWAARNCSFVELRTYKQLVSRSTSFRKMLKKFHKHSGEQEHAIAC